ncbi:MAG: ferritin family protein [Myxococcaceae bacterium]
MTDGPSSTWQTDAARVRLVLMRELETISVYEALAREAQAPEAKAFFEHLAAEEKEHVAEATYLLRKLDETQNADFEKPYSEAHFRGEAHPRPVSAEAPAPAAELPPPSAARSGDADLRRRPFIPEELRIPTEPSQTLYAIPAPPSPTAGAFTVGSLRRRR